VHEEHHLQDKPVCFITIFLYACIYFGIIYSILQKSGIMTCDVAAAVTVE